MEPVEPLVQLFVLQSSTHESVHGQPTTPTQLDVARNISAGHCRPDVAALQRALLGEVKAATGGGVEYAVEIAGSTQALDTAFQITRRGGTTVTAELAPPTATLPLTPVTLVGDDIRVSGV